MSCVMDESTIGRARDAIADLVAELERQRDENARLRSVCAEAYQFAGEVGAPERVLDNLAAAADGRPLPHASFLPVTFSECDPLSGA